MSKSWEHSPFDKVPDSPQTLDFKLEQLSLCLSDYKHKQRDCPLPTVLDICSEVANMSVSTLSDI